MSINYRQIYESYHGSIPKDESGRAYEIHHLDGEHSNISRDNLKAVTIQEHYDIHYAQGDWAACLIMSDRMKISPEEKSRLSSLANKKRVNDGTHHFIGGELVRKLVADGKHNLQKRLDGTSLSSDRVTNGTHPWLDSEKQRERALKQVTNGNHPFQKRLDGTSLQTDKVKAGTHHLLGGKIHRKRVADGTHPFLGGEIQRKSNLNRIANGTDPSQKPWQCEHCGKEGKGVSNYNRWHGARCKSQIT